MEIIRLTDTTSTNDFLLSGAFPDREVTAVASYQSAGKGMGTNTWESECGKNLLFSILIHPDWIEASMQYVLSMVEAVAVCEVLSEYADDISIKWPNDIYWRDKKISGTRIDGNIKGRRMSDLVIGTGINVNQLEFHSDAPNPVSLLNITGKEHDTEEILSKIIERFDLYRKKAEEEWKEKGTAEAIMKLYHNNLYRRTGWHKYEDSKGIFEAELIGVSPNGTLSLSRRNGEKSNYEFKEIKFLI